jgi:hypothetical protein
MLVQHTTQRGLDLRCAAQWSIYIFSERYVNREGRCMQRGRPTFFSAGAFSAARGCCSNSVAISFSAAQCRRSPSYKFTVTRKIRALCRGATSDASRVHSPPATGGEGAGYCAGGTAPCADLK